MCRDLLILIILSLLITGCESDAEVDVPTEPEKIVLTSFFNPSSDTNIVKIYKTDPIFREGNELDLSTSIIKISDGTNEVKLDMGQNPFDYQTHTLKKSKFNLGYNKTYTIKANVSGTQVQKTFTTIDSNSIQIKSITIDTIIKESFFEVEFILQSRIKFIDPANEENYYRIEVVPTVRRFVAGRYIEEEWYGGDNTYTLLSDKGQNGAEINLTKDYIYYYSDEPDFISMNVYIAKIDADTYKYLKSIQNIDEEDPFSEPVLIYSNVPGGLGLIGSQQVFMRKQAL